MSVLSRTKETVRSTASRDVVASPVRRIVKWDTALMVQASADGNTVPVLPRTPGEACQNEPECEPREASAPRVGSRSAV